MTLKGPDRVSILSLQLGCERLDELPGLSSCGKERLSYGGASWRFGEGPRRISVIMRDISHFFTCPCPILKRVIKDVITRKRHGEGT
jgi:hypothetical protein